MPGRDPELPSGMTLRRPRGPGYATAASARSASVVSACRFQPVCGLPGRPEAGSAGSSARGMFAIPAATSRTSFPRLRRCDRDEGERERGALAEALVRRGVRRPGKAHRDEELAGAEGEQRPVVLGRAPVQIEERNLARTGRRANLDGCAARGERGREVGRVRRDAVPGLEVVLAMVADLRVAGVPAAQPAVPLLPAVVPAARVLADVPGDGADVADQRRGGEGRCPGDCGVRRDER